MNSDGKNLHGELEYEVVQQKFVSFLHFSHLSLESPLPKLQMSQLVLLLQQVLSHRFKSESHWFRGKTAPRDTGHMSALDRKSVV